MLTFDISVIYPSKKAIRCHVGFVPLRWPNKGQKCLNQKTSQWSQLVLCLTRALLLRLVNSSSSHSPQHISASLSCVCTLRCNDICHAGHYGDQGNTQTEDGWDGDGGGGWERVEGAGHVVRCPLHCLQSDAVNGHSDDWMADWLTGLHTQSLGRFGWSGLLNSLFLSLLLWLSCHIRSLPPAPPHSFTHSFTWVSLAWCTTPAEVCSCSFLFLLFFSFFCPLLDLKLFEFFLFFFSLAQNTIFKT